MQKKNETGKNINSKELSESEMAAQGSINNEKKPGGAGTKKVSAAEMKKNGEVNASSTNKTNKKKSSAALADPRKKRVSSSTSSAKKTGEVKKTGITREDSVNTTEKTWSNTEEKETTSTRHSSSSEKQWSNDTVKTENEPYFTAGTNVVNAESAATNLANPTFYAGITAPEDASYTGGQNVSDFKRDYKSDPGAYKTYGGGGATTRQRSSGWVAFTWIMLVALVGVLMIAAFAGRPSNSLSDASADLVGSESLRVGETAEFEIVLHGANDKNNMSNDNTNSNTSVSPARQNNLKGTEDSMRNVNPLSNSSQNGSHGMHGSSNQEINNNPYGNGAGTLNNANLNSSKNNYSHGVNNLPATRRESGMDQNSYRPSGDSSGTQEFNRNNTSTHGFGYNKGINVNQSGYHQNGMSPQNDNRTGNGNGVSRGGTTNQTSYGQNGITNQNVTGQNGIFSGKNLNNNHPQGNRTSDAQHGEYNQNTTGSQNKHQDAMYGTNPNSLRNSEISNMQGNGSGVNGSGTSYNEGYGGNGYTDNGSANITDQSLNQSNSNSAGRNVGTETTQTNTKKSENRKFFNRKQSKDIKLSDDLEVVWTVNGKVVKSKKASEEGALKFSFIPSSSGEYDIGVKVGNYSNLMKTKKLAVKNPVLKLSIENAQYEYGSEIPNFNYKMDGLRNDRKNGSIKFAPEYESEGMKSNRVGKYPLKFKGNPAIDGYDVEVTNGNLQINPRQIKLGTTRISKVYDGTRTLPAEQMKRSLHLQGIINNDEVYAICEGLEFEDSGVGTNKTISHNHIALGGNGAANYTMQTDGIRFTGEITPRPLILSGVKASNKIYDGKNSVTFESIGTLEGVVAGDHVSVGRVEAHFSDPSIGRNKQVRITGITLVGKDAKNYTVSAANNAYVCADIIPPGSMIEGDWNGANQNAMNYGTNQNGMNYGINQSTANYGTNQNGMNYGANQNTANYGTNQNGMNYGANQNTANYGANQNSYGINQNAMNYGANRSPRAYGTQQNNFVYGMGNNRAGQKSANLGGYGANVSSNYTGGTGRNSSAYGVQVQGNSINRNEGVNLLNNTDNTGYNQSRTNNSASYKTLDVGSGNYGIAGKNRLGNNKMGINNGYGVENQNYRTANSISNNNISNNVNNYGINNQNNNMNSSVNNAKITERKSIGNNAMDYRTANPIYNTNYQNNAQNKRTASQNNGAANVNNNYNMDVNTNVYDSTNRYLTANNRGNTENYGINTFGTQSLNKGNTSGNLTTDRTAGQTRTNGQDYRESGVNDRPIGPYSSSINPHTGYSTTNDNNATSYNSYNSNGYNSGNGENSNNYNASINYGTKGVSENNYHGNNTDSSAIRRKPPVLPQPRTLPGIRH